MQTIHAPLPASVPLYPLLYFLNTVLNGISTFVYFVILIFYCHFDLSKKAILWIFVRNTIGCVHFFMLHFFIKYYFILKKTKKCSANVTTFISVLYIFVLAIELSWMIIGTVFTAKYSPEVGLDNFYTVAWIYLIVCWLEICFLPGLFLFFLIIQLRRYRLQRRYLEDIDNRRETNRVTKPEDAFMTGGCCACCVGDTEDRCCCCLCICCEPQGIMASYILGEDLLIFANEQTRWEEEEEEREEREEREREREERVNDGCCSCIDERREEEEEEMRERLSLSIPQPTPQPIISSTLAPTSISTIRSTSTPTSTSTTTLPTVIVPSDAQLELVDGVPVLNNYRLVEAVADDGSGRVVYVAIPKIE